MTQAKRWTHSNKSVFNIGYHLIWCVKYRKPVLVGDTEKRLKELILLKGQDIGITVVSLEVMPEHLHIFIKASPVDSPHYIVQQLKGYTSKLMRQEFKELRTRIPSLWTRSYYCESVGHISENAVKRYIEEQKTNDFNI